MNCENNNARGLDDMINDFGTESDEDCCMDNYSTLNDFDVSELDECNDDDMRNYYTSCECSDEEDEEDEGSNCCKECFSAGLEEGYETGVADGRTSACRRAYKKGFCEGRKEGFEEGREKGLEEGYEKAKQEVLEYVIRRNNCRRRRCNCCCRRCNCC